MLIYLYFGETTVQSQQEGATRLLVISFFAKRKKNTYYLKN